MKGTHNMETLDQYLAEQLKNPKFKKEWDELEMEPLVENIKKDCSCLWQEVKD